VNKVTERASGGPGDLVYTIGDRLYINLTNRCVNDCTFCIRRSGPGVAGARLWLEREPPAREYIQAVEHPERYSEIVFCGYGEPMLRPDVLAEVARDIRRRCATPIRVNTNGQARLFLRRDVLPELVGLVDVFSVSLNAQDNATYQAICRPAYGDRAYPAVLDFAREAARLFPRVVLTVVAVPGVDIEACRRIAEELGAEFRVRDYLDSGDRYLDEQGPDEVGRPGGGEQS